jgi:hypothetical protein
MNAKEFKKIADKDMQYKRIQWVIANFTNRNVPFIFDNLVDGKNSSFWFNRYFLKKKK